MRRLSLVEYTQTLNDVSELDKLKVILDGNESDIRYISLSTEKSFKTTYKLTKNPNAKIGRYVDVSRLRTFKKFKK